MNSNTGRHTFPWINVWAEGRQERRRAPDRWKESAHGKGHMENVEMEAWQEGRRKVNGLVDERRDVWKKDGCWKEDSSGRWTEQVGELEVD